ncbi:hypothetical protein [Myroides sp. N17-2]|uniref:hypothetical protein n=1 Tax=Myroides sp. N17-2 TaxID=2030799 RepID=UPI0013043BD8|nr:hypothetical protein [Myroides sp. N17-2]
MEKLLFVNLAVSEYFTYTKVGDNLCLSLQICSMSLLKVDIINEITECYVEN